MAESKLEAREPDDKLESLKDVTLALLRELETLSAPDLEQGVNFYEAVRRFEKNLLECFLAHTYGNQTRAAQLLKLKIQTLNGKIKQHQIDVNRFKGE